MFSDILDPNIARQFFNIQPQPQPQPQPPPQPPQQPQPQPPIIEEPPDMNDRPNQAPNPAPNQLALQPVRRRIQIPRYASLIRHYYDTDEDEDSDEDVIQNTIQFLPNAIYPTCAYLCLKPLDKRIPDLYLYIIDCFDVEIAQNGLIYRCVKPLTISNVQSNLNAMRDFYLLVPIHESLDDHSVRDMKVRSENVDYAFLTSRLNKKIQTRTGLSDTFDAYINIPLVISQTHNYVKIRFKEGLYNIPVGFEFFVRIDDLVLPKEEIEISKPKTKEARKEKKDEKKDE